MNISLKKMLSLFLAVIIAASMFCVGTAAFGDDLVAINETNFKDPVFRAILSERYDTEAGNEGYLSAAERNVSFMSLSGLANGRKVQSLDGIEFFADSLTNLRCGGIGVEEFDASSLPNLTSLTCQGNELTTLDVSSLSELITLNCSDNALQNLVLGNSVSLETVHCYGNELTEIDTSGLVNLLDFRCDQNQLKSIDVSGNTKLIEFNCSSNHLAKLDLSANTSLGDVTDYMIGQQTVTAEATADLGSIVIGYAQFGLDPSKLYHCSLEDLGVGAGFDGENFVVYDVSQLENGFDYTYNVGLPDSENMSVYVDVTRNFYQVNFYAASDMIQLISKSFTDENGGVQQPNVTDIPQCKAFGGWSEDITNVTSDMNVYPIWEDAHSYSLTAFDGDIATVTCSECGDSFNLSFKEAINAKTGDSNYSQYLDVVQDGYINAKDYAKLTKMF